MFQLPAIYIHIVTLGYIDESFSELLMFFFLVLCDVLIDDDEIIVLSHLI